MIVLWVQVQIKQSNVKEKAFKYVDEVGVYKLTVVRYASHNISPPINHSQAFSVSISFSKAV